MDYIISQNYLHCKMSDIKFKQLCSDELFDEAEKFFKKNKISESALFELLKNNCLKGNIEFLIWLSTLDENIIKSIIESTIQDNDEEICTLFTETAANGHLECCKFLTRFYNYFIPEVFGISLVDAIINNHLHIVDWLIEEYTLKDTYGDSKTCISTGYMTEAFQLACERGFVDYAQNLLGADKNIDISEEDDYAFRMAKFYNQTSVVEWLLSINPDLETKFADWPIQDLYYPDCSFEDL